MEIKGLDGFNPKPLPSLTTVKGRVLKGLLDAHVAGKTAGLTVDELVRWIDEPGYDRTRVSPAMAPLIRDGFVLKTPAKRLSDHGVLERIFCIRPCVLVKANTSTDSRWRS